MVVSTAKRPVVDINRVFVFRLIKTPFCLYLAPTVVAVGHEHILVVVGSLFQRQSYDVGVDANNFYPISVKQILEFFSQMPDPSDEDAEDE